jgi:hypothetical protein
MCITRNQVGTRTGQVESPDLASNYHLFLHIKKFLAGKNLRGDQETKDTVLNWLKGFVVNSSNEGVPKQVSQYDKCLNLCGKYVQN